jgi:hypothetical protein
MRHALVIVVIVVQCNVGLVLGQATRPVISGRVLDESGNPMPRVQVSIQRPVVVSTLTDSVGRFVLRGTPGSHLIHVHSIG